VSRQDKRCKRMRKGALYSVESLSFATPAVVVAHLVRGVLGFMLPGTTILGLGGQMH
jgi:hypothetical protein